MVKASVAIQILPDAENDNEKIKIIDEVISYIESLGLKMFVSPFETTIEGDFDKLMEIVKNCQLIAIKSGANGVKSYVKIFFNPNEGILTINEKTDKYTNKNSKL